jgi:hypothetical protein
MQDNPMTTKCLLLDINLDMDNYSLKSIIKKTNEEKISDSSKSFRINSESSFDVDK